MQWLIDIILERVMLRFSGTIQMWTGTIANIPDGALLCDGTNGTPDLRDRFVRGAPDSTEPGSLGGCDAHVHHILGDTELTVPPMGAAFSPPGATKGGSHLHALDLCTACGSSLPKYYEVLYIMWA